jgi:general secretion pathway protein G
MRNDLADLGPSEEDWQIFCSQDSAAELVSLFGIGPVNEQNTSLQKTYTHLSSLATALESYREDYGTYPDPITTAGIDSLTRPRRGSTAAEDAYVSKIPTDPWGNDYIYRTPRLLHGAEKSYTLYTLGKNGVEGGTGEDADFSSEHLKYLDHIKNL